jgi:hypothetical protein
VHVRGGTAGTCVGGQVLDAVGRHQQDADLWSVGDDTRGRGQAVDAGEVDVHQHDVRLRREVQLDRLLAGGRLCCHNEAARSGNDGAGG